MPAGFVEPSMYSWNETLPFRRLGGEPLGVPTQGSKACLGKGIERMCPAPTRGGGKPTASGSDYPGRRSSLTAGAMVKSAVCRRVRRS